MNYGEFATSLADWFGKVGRKMPWRETRDPYAIWLSEIMLQQTQVKTATPYYLRFLARWPTIAELAAAEDGDVMKAWEGLGYYARCRNLLRAARIIEADHDGVFPYSLEEVVALPGIGRSTAGAILTFARGQRHPLLDGNVKRVLSRLFDEDGEITRAAVERRLWAESTAMLDAAEDSWTHNQALMELGATACSPRNPSCESCPTQRFCASYAAGTQSQRPVKKKKKPIPHKEIGVAVIEDGTRVLIQLRPAKGLLGGLWEFPGGKQEPSESIQETVLRECREELGITVGDLNHLVDVKHTYSHFKITMHAFRCRVLTGSPTPNAADECRWVERDDLDRYAFPKANKRVLEALTVLHKRTE
ncbi:MAG: A/G-specific adenine glycosylase [Myxococcota bacterium]|jgi:A/G-specific adenine glycosylase